MRPPFPDAALGLERSPQRPKAPTAGAGAGGSSSPKHPIDSAAGDGGDAPAVKKRKTAPSTIGDAAAPSGREWGRDSGTGVTECPPLEAPPPSGAAKETNRAASGAPPSVVLRPTARSSVRGLRSARSREKEPTARAGSDSA